MFGNEYHIWNNLEALLEILFEYNLICVFYSKSAVDN